VKPDLVIECDDREQLEFRAVLPASDSEDPILVESRWQGFAPPPQPAEEWQDEILDKRKPDGTLEICLGRWHSLSRAEAERLYDWLGDLLEGGERECALARPGPRQRLSALAERQICATLAG